MTLEEAIEILKPLPNAPEVALTSNEQTAVKLLIEAGKRMVKQRDWGFVSNRKLLPGETEE